MIPVIQQAHASQLVDGAISDGMCGSKHMLPGKTDVECIRECVKGKARYALVTDNEVYTLAGKPQTIAKFAGKHVQIGGSVRDHTITVEFVRETKSRMPAGMPM
jgi:hypothetical protein